MGNCEATILEPFLESGRHCPAGLGAIDYLAGYRCRETGAIVCAINLPANVVEALIMGSVIASTVVTPSGQIESSFELVTTRAQTSQGLTSEPIDALVARALTRDSLRLEGATKRELEQLHDRLGKSLDLVAECLQTFHQAGHHVNGSFRSVD